MGVYIIRSHTGGMYLSKFSCEMIYLTAQRYIDISVTMFEHITQERGSTRGKPCDAVVPSSLPSRTWNPRVTEVYSLV